MYLPELQLHEEQVFYRGKVRDVYRIRDRLVSIASNRISAFDHILPRPIPFKGQVLNQLAAHYLRAAAPHMPVWLQSTPHPTVSIGIACEPIPIEMVVRGYLAGHAWRVYRSGERKLCGVHLPEGLKEGDRLPGPIITPATKAQRGHDEDISATEILERSIVTAEVWQSLCEHALTLFNIGTEMAANRGLILVDTKYEFGYHQGEICLIDEVHTPDSSRYYISEGYERRQSEGVAQEQLSKEFVREWLIERGFQGLEGQFTPDMPNQFVKTVSTRYIHLYEQLTNEKFDHAPTLSNDELEDVIKEALVI